LELIPLQTGQLNWIFSPGSGRRIEYTSAPGIVNQNLTWETATTTNFGVEASFLQNRLQVEFSGYERMTTNMVGPSEAKPGVLGANPPSINNATLRTRGWDLSLGWKQNVNNHFSWFANVNLSDYTSVLIKYNNPALPRIQHGRRIDKQGSGRYYRTFPWHGYHMELGDILSRKGRQTLRLPDGGPNGKKERLPDEN
jgi:outer membrane receptor protein involved in Fe transport